MGDRSDIERVLAGTDIVRIVRERMDLREKGREWVGLCPFHDDRSPSMYVSPAKQIFKCFACGAGGDALTFVQRYDGVEFRQALEDLAEAAGIELAKGQRDAGHGQARSERAAVLEANAFAQDLFVRTLRDPATGERARQMIARRGIGPEMVERFGLGAAPDAWDALATAARRARKPIEPLVAAQLVRPREGGHSHYDLFRNRLIFPITDQGGRVIAFGGRRLDEDDQAKYFNSPESAVFKKSAVLYGLRQATPGIRERGYCIVTEGYTDTIACHQAGFTNTVATLGTAFTSEHARLLRRLCTRVVLLFDGDEAGLDAADRAVGVLFAQPMDVQIAILDAASGAKDPDELLGRSDGPAAFQALVDGATDVLAYRFDRLRARLAGRGRAALLSGVEDDIRWLAEHGLRGLEPARQDRLFAQLATISGLDQHRLRELAASTGRRARAGDHRAPTGVPPLTPADRLLGLVLCEPSAWAGLSQDDIVLLRDAVAGGPSEPIAAAVDRLSADGELTGMAALRAALEDPAFEWATTLVAWAEQSVGGGEIDNKESLTEIVGGLLRQVAGRAAQLDTDPLARVRAARAHMARFHADPGRIARP